MPTYDYQCQSCDKTIEFFHSMQRKPKVTCDECGESMTKLIGAGSGVIFKGPGFHCNDYPSGDGPRKKLEESPKLIAGGSSTG